MNAKPKMNGHTKSKILLDVDMLGYYRAKGISYINKVRCLDPSRDYVEMEVTPEELKWLIDNCVDIKMKK